MNMGKKIICVKDIPSNLIEEAIFILKPNAVENKKVTIEEKFKEIVLGETEDITNEYINRIQEEKLSEKNKADAKKRELKKEVLYVTGLFIILFICISFVI